MAELTERERDELLRKLFLEQIPKQGQQPPIQSAQRWPSERAPTGARQEMQQAFAPPPELEVGQIQMPPSVEIGDVEGVGGNRDIIVEMDRGRRRGPKWMENPEVMQTVLSGLKGKGFVDQDGQPIGGMGVKGLTKKERALYNRMRIQSKRLRQRIARTGAAADKALAIVE